MKHQLKRALALALAVLMTCSVLPMEAMAARIVDDEAQETPVLDRNDPVADTQGRYDDEIGETPIDPIDPDPLPVDPEWTDNTGMNITINPDGTWSVTVTTSDATAQVGNWALAFVPDYAVGEGTLSPSALWNNGSGTVINSSGSTVSGAEDLKTIFSTANTGIATEHMLIVGETNGVQGAIDNTFTFTSVDYGGLPDIDTLLANLPASGTAVNMRVFFYAQASNNNKVISKVEEYRQAGPKLPSPIYALNIANAAAPSVERISTDGKDASYTRDTNTSGDIVIPLPNIGTEVAQFFKDNDAAKDIMGITMSATEGIAAAHHVDNPNSWTATSGGADASLKLSLSSLAPGTITVKVPYYKPAEEEDGNPTYINTATITIQVVSGANKIFANPLNFTVYEGEGSTEPQVLTFQSKGYRWSASKLTQVTLTHVYWQAATPAMTKPTYMTVTDNGAKVRTKGATATSDVSRDLIEYFSATVNSTIDNQWEVSKQGHTEVSISGEHGLTADNSGSSPQPKVYDNIEFLVKVSAKADGVSSALNFSTDTTAIKVPVTITVLPKEAPPEKFTYDYELTYDLNGGTGTIPNNPDTHSTPATTATTDSHTFTLPANPTKDNHTFAGWKVDDTETVLATTDTTYTMTGIQNGKATATLTAQWTENTKYTVSFAHSSAGHPTTLTTDLPTSTTPASAWPGDSVSWTANPAATGWTFLGWSTASNATVAGFGDATTKSYTLPDNTAANVTLYAVWSQNKHEVEYKWATADGQLKGQPKTTGGTAITLPTQADVAEGATFEVSNALTAGTTYVDSTGLGWTFNGWKDGGGTLHVPGAADSKTVTMGTEKITLTADWTVKNYTVTYTKGADGSSPAAATIANSSKQVQHGAKHTVGTDGGTGVTGVTMGWLFNGWNQTGELTITADTTITANWKVTVTFNAHGGSAVDSVDVAYNTPVSQPTCTWAGHGLDGWYKEAAYTNKWNFSSNVTGPMTLHAKWTANPQTITWDMNYTDGPNIVWNRSNGDNFFNTTDQTAAPTPTREGYNFLGWFAATSGGTAITTFPTTVTSDLVYYAHWELKTYAITYNANGHGTAPGDGSKTHGVAYTIADIAAGEDGWRFDGWNTADDGTGTNYAVGDSYTTNAPLALHAKWTANTVTVQARKDTAATAYMNGKAVALHPATGSDITGTLDASGNYIFSAVPNGTYNVLIDGKQAKTSAGANLTVTVNDNAQIVSAWWYTAEAKTGGNGTVTVAGGGETATTAATANATASIVVPAGTSVTWTAVPSPNYVFVEWTENNATTTTTTVNSLIDKTTRTGTFAQGTFDATVSVTWDGEAPSGSLTSSVTVNGESKTVKAGTNSVSFTGLTQGTSYAITVDGHATGVSLDKDNTSKTITYVSAIAVTGGNGTATVTGKDAANVTFGTKTTANANAGTSATLWVLPGATVSWTDTANTYYRHKQWEDKATDGSVTIAVTDQTVNASTTRKAIFEQKTCTVTVNIKDIHLSGNPTDHNFTGDVKLGNAATYKDTISNKAVATINVPQSDTSYDIYLGNADTYVDVTPNGDTASATVNFYELKVTAEANGKASLEGTTINTGGSKSNYYLPGTAGITLGATADTNYVFSNWSGDTGNVTGLTADTAANTITTSTAGKTAALTANFQKVAYSATIKVFLNNVQQADSDMGNGQPITATPTIAKTSGETTETPNLTYDSANKLWNVSNLRNSNTYTVTVSSITGSYTWTITKEGENVEARFFGVTVENGTYGNTTNETYLKAAGTTRAVLPRGENVEINANPDDGYTFSKWLAGDAANPTNDLDTATTKVTAPDSGNFSFTDGDNGYTTADGKDLYLKPVYTYEVTVHTKHGEDFVDTTVTAKENGGTSTGTITKVVDGKYTVSGLLPTKEYSITVNDFESNVDIDEDDIGTPVVVNMYQITVNRAYHKPSSGTPNGTAQVQVKTDAYANTSRYLPQGASTDTTNTVKVKAAAGTNERLTHSVTYATEGDVALWSMAPTNKGVSIATEDINEGNPTVTVANLSGDVTITAHFVLQYNVTVDVSNGTATTPTSTAAFTGKQSSASTIKDPATGALVDATTYVKAQFTKGTGETLTGWTISEDGGTLYSNDDLAEGHKITDPSTHTGEEVYFVPAKEGATLTANVEAAKYTVMVTANLDNVAKTDATVELHYTEGGTEKVAAMTYNETDKVYKSNDELPFNTTYTIWTNIATQTTTTESAIKTIRFTAAEADADTNLSEEVNYYTILLKADPTGDAGKRNKVEFNAINATTSDHEAEMIFLAKAGGEDVTVAAAAQYDATVSPRYRFDDWTQTKPADTVTGTFTETANKGIEKYGLPGENTLKAQKDGDFVIKPDNQITLTAKFVERIKVTVELDAEKPSDFSSAFGVKVTEEAATPDWTTATQTVEIDKGDSVLVYGGGNGDVTSNLNYALSEWKVKPEHGEGVFDNSYLAGTNDTAAAVTDTGYKLQGGKFTPGKDTTLVLHAWTKPKLTDGWTYDKAQPDKSSPEPPKDRRSTWTPNDGAPTTVRIYDRGDGSTFNKTLSEGNYATSNVPSSTTNQKYYTVDADYLKDEIPAAQYYLGVDYTLGADTHPNQTTGTAYVGITIASTKNKLTEVLVEVKDGSDTANQSDPNRDAVQYKSHKEGEPKVLKNDLVFTWYYANVKPTWTWDGLNKDKTDAEALQAAQTLVNALDGVHSLTTTANYPTDAATEVKEGIVNIKNTDAFTDDLRGKYVFAIVTVGTKAGDGTITPGAETAYGTVITNAIPVDYDAVITVNEDDYPVDETEAAGYAVYLWPTDGGAFDLDEVVDGKKVAIPTEYDKDTKTFKTKKSPLIGEKNYHVYVREVEGKDEQYIQHKNDSNAVVISRTNTTDTVDYYTVTLTDLGKKSWANADSTTHPYLEHFKDSGNKEVGEAWDYANMPAVKAETSVNQVEVLSGKAVLKTTAVKATAKALTSEGNTDKAWLQDYNLDWYTDMTTAGTLAVTANMDQTNKTAITAGHTTAGITHATEITGKLKQNTYVIKGDVKDLTSGTKTGQIESDVTPAANKAVPTLTYTVDDSTSYVFKATGVTVNGGNGATVTFKVPRSSVGENKGAIEGTYFLEATPKSNPATTLKGYSVPTDTEVPDPWTRNVNVTAGTTGAALNNRFTIFIESTALTLEVKDEETDTTHVHQRSGNTADTAKTFKEDTGRHNDTWKYNSKTASYTKQVIITNKGNTPLKVTPTLEKYTKNASGDWEQVASFSYTPADNAFEDDLGNNKMTGDPKKIGFSNWKTSYDLAANGGAEAIPVTIPANLENSDDVRYRFIFTSADGRDGYTGTGPTLWFELETIVDPVEVTKVTTEHPGGDIMKYRVKTTTIAEDEDKAGTPNYDALQKPQENSGLTSGAPKADNDLVYEWYVADWDDTVTFNATDGKLYNGSTAMTPETKGVSKDTLTFDLDENADAQGRTLYLLVKGQHNAQGAATTPDVIGEPEPPMLMPYTGKIYIEEDTDKITAATGYKVYLWNKKDGTFDPDSDEKIEATWVAPADGNPGYFAASNLYAADPETATTPYTYEVWTNTVKGTTTVFQNSNQTVTGEKREATVVYHSVTLNNTTVDNAPYNANFTVNSDLFFRYVDGTTVTEIYGAGATDEQKKLNAPTAKAGAIDVATSETNKWVQTGTSVTATYPAWTKDYALTWDSDTTAVNTPTTASTKTYTVNDETEVDTQLKLNIYDVVANVNGTTGKVAYFTMVLTDGEQTYTFTSKTDSPDGNAILGVDTTVSEIVAGDEVVFKLPAAGPYVTKAKMPADTAAKLISYTNTDNSETEVTEGQEETTTIDVVVPVGGAEYAANLQGDGVSISFADNIPAATTIDGVNLETSGAKSQNGNAGITPKEGSVEISKKEAVQTIHLNYNSYTSAIPVEISFTNKSKYDSSHANDLKEVTFTKNGTTTAKPGGGDSITIDASSELSETGIDMVSNADAAHPEVKKVVLNIQPGLHVGTTYTFKADVAFKDNKTPQNSATTSYTLNVIIDPLPITSLTIDKADDGDLKLTDYNAITAPNGGVFVDDDNNAATPAVPVSTVNFQAGDVSYVWAKAPVNISVDKNSFAMTTGATNTITATADDVTVTSETGTTLSAANIEPGVNYYLIAYSAKNTSNAADFAVSPAFKTTYPGIVYLNIDGDLKQGKDDADSADGTGGGAYKVVFVNNDDNTVVEGSVTWKDVGGGKYAYSQDLNPNTAGYTAKISRAKGDLTDAHLIALDKTIKGEPTIGTADTDANVVVANFFTVNPVPFTAAPYQTGTGEEFDHAAGTDGKSTTNTDIEPKFAIGTGADKADLADAIPTVLSGQTVTATAPETTPGSNIAWTQDYLLTWQADDATGADDTFADANDKTPKNVSADNAVKAAGAYSQEITAKTYIGGRLDQRTYTVVGTVKGTGGYVGKVDMAFKPATGDTRSFTLTTGTAGTGKINDNFKLGDGDGDGIHGEPNDTVTFKVVKGAYEITAFDGAATGATDTPANAPASTVLKVTVGAAPDELDDVSDRSKETLGGNAPTNPDVTANGRVFTMYVAGTDLKLGVDDDDAATPSTSNAPQVSEGAGNVANNNKHADNVKTYYFNSTSTTPIGLTLSNPGNADLKVKAEVFRFGPTDTVPNYATGSWTGGTALDKDHTYKDNATGSVVTIASTTTWATTGETVAVGAGVADSGVDAVNAGSITLTKTAPNTADAVYIVRFTSTYVDNNSTTPMTGPTVYYVLDLTVNPLPIVSVSATPDANGTMRLENFVSATEDTAEKPENDGLDSVLVDHDGDGKTAATGGTDPMGAKLAGLAGADVSYAWYTAPVYAADGTTPVTVDKSDFQFNAATGALELTTAGAAKGLTIGAAAPGDGGKTYKPTDAEQGRNVYLVAYRASTTCNAADLAVSAALYAQVTIKLEARRTDDVNAPGTASPLLSTVQIEGTYSEQTAHSNTDGTNPGIVVNDRDNRVIAFTGDMNDYLHGKLAGTEDKPNDAKWYFVGWNDSDGKTPSGNVGTFTNKTDYTGTEYTVAAQATVIGYYDKLPELKGAKSCTLGETIAEASRTFTYTHYDGSGNVKIMIKPVGNGKFLATGTEGEDLTSPRQITVNDLGKIAGQTTGGTIGGDGDYVLDTAWIMANLDGDQQYTITFYDLEEGKEADGYEGYDRSISYTTSTGPKDVTAVVANANKGQGHTVQVKGVADGAEGETSTATTKDGLVTLIATPNPGYVFTGWEVINGTGEFTEDNGEIKTNPTFRPTAYTVTVEASFRKANLTKEDGHAKIYYGTQRFVGNTETVEDNYKDLTVGTSDTGVATDYAYTWLTGADLKTYLTTATADGGLGMSEADADILVAKTETARYKTVEGETSGWLEWHDADVADNENKFVVKAAAKDVNVEKDDDKNDVGNELVVYVKATEQNSEQDLIVSFTIDIMTSTLAIRTDGTNASSGGDGHTQDDDQRTADGSAYKTKYVGVYGTEGTEPDETKVNGTATDGKIIHGNAVEREWFEFISIDNVSDEDKLDHLIEALTDGNKNNAGGATGENGEFTYVVTDKGVWKSVVPPTFNGAGSADENEIEYTFEFHYTGAEGVEDDYNYSDASIKIKIPVQRPLRDLLIADEVTDYTDLKRGDTYSDIEAPLPDDGVTTPTKLLAGHDTKRLGESITYLDEEPVYTAKLQRIGAFDEGTIKLELDPEENKTAVGFVLVDNNGNEIALNNATALKALLDAAAAELDEDGAEATIKLKLAPVHDKVWVGEHYIRFKLSGAENGETLERRYTLSLTVDPRKITKLDVTTTPTEPKPDEVKPTLEGDDPTEPFLDDKGEDKYGNTPVKDEKVEWTQAGGKPIKEEVTVEIDPNYVIDPEEIKPETELNDKTDKDSGKPNADLNTEVKPEEPTPDTNGGKVVIIQKTPILMFDDVKTDGGNPTNSDPATTGPAINDARGTISMAKGFKPTNTYTINLGAYGSSIYDIDVELKSWDDVFADCTLTPAHTDNHWTVEQLDDVNGDPAGNKNAWALDLTNLKTDAPGTYVVKLRAIGYPKDGSIANEIEASYTLTINIYQPSTPGGGGGTPEPPCPCKVLYHIGLHGTTTDATIEDVSENNRPVKVPAVTALDGYVFRGWSLSNPATLKKGEKPVLVDPKTVDVKGESVIFYAVIEERPFHEHYVIGYPNGNFGPADNIDRASVATIIARAILPDFKEGANYGNPGKYTDVSGHWAESAIAYCSKYGVFEGYTDGTFKPNQPITRQEFALVIARLDGVMTPGEMDFTDIDEAGPWALGGIYTAYEKGWVNGYPDGTFKPLNNIRRDEAVKVFNAYLNRGVDADGLSKLHEYVHSGVASNVTGNGTDEYMTWPDVPQGHWAYYEIVEAANDHEYEPDFESELGYTLPETWDKCWIDERWRYHDDLNDGGPNAALVSAGFRVWLH